MPGALAVELTISYSEAAEIFGTSIHAISAIAKAHELEPKPVRRNRNAKGLDIDDLMVIGRALNMTDEEIRSAISGRLGGGPSTAK